MEWVGEAWLLWGEVGVYFLLLWFGRRGSGASYPDMRSFFESWAQPSLSDTGQGLHEKIGPMAFRPGELYFAKCYFSKGNDTARHF